MCSDSRRLRRQRSASLDIRANARSPYLNDGWPGSTSGHSSAIYEVIMKALQFVGDNRCEVNDVAMPTIGADEVLLASRSVGICHSDLELLAGRYIIPFEFPVIPGHEWSAEVVAVGKAVKGLGTGDRVVGECVIGREDRKSVV